jgi:hypothetical protein
MFNITPLGAGTAQLVQQFGYSLSDLGFVF